MDIALTHENADLDALASLGAAQLLFPEAISLRGAHVSSYVHRYLALHREHLDLVKHTEVNPAEVETAIVVDTHKKGQLGHLVEFVEGADRVVVFDHHPDGPDPIEADTACIEPVGACITLLAERLIETGIEPTPEFATLMMLGLYADTGRLSFDRTTARDIEVAARCVRWGANLSVMNRYLRERFTDEQRRLMAEMLSGSQILDLQGVKVAIATGRAQQFVSNISAVAQDLLERLGVEALIALVEFEQKEHVQMVGRSRVPYVDVGNILTAFGGGGHAGAAGASVKEKSLEQVVDQLRDYLEQQAFRPTTVSDVMTSPVETLERDLTLKEARAQFSKWDVTGAPVVSDGRIEGILSVRDLRDISEDDGRLPVSSHMSHHPVTVDPDATIEEALDQMTEHNIGRLPVVEGSVLKGIVSRTDIIGHLYD